MIRTQSRTTFPAKQDGLRHGVGRFMEPAGPIQARRMTTLGLSKLFEDSKDWSLFHKHYFHSMFYRDELTSPVITHRGWPGEGPWYRRRWAAL